MGNERREKIKQDLLDRLELNGTVGDYFIDLVEDYMTFYDIKNELYADIEMRGVSLQYKNGPNQYGQKKNDSVQEAVKVNMQMLKILKELGIEAGTEVVDTDDEL